MADFLAVAKMPGYRNPTEMRGVLASFVENPRLSLQSLTSGLENQKGPLGLQPNEPDQHAWRCVMADAAHTPIRIQLSRKKGWRMPPNTVKVDRTNKTFGNPFAIGSNPSQFSTALPSTCETAAEAVACFQYYADTWMRITSGRWVHPLRGKNLACWCAPDAACHADVLLELANSPAPDRLQGEDV